MKKIQLAWVKTDNGFDKYLSIISNEDMREVAQLRKQLKTTTPVWYNYDESKRNWFLSPTGITDEAIIELFGKNWYNETYGGFETVEKFKDWTRSKLCL